MSNPARHPFKMSGSDAVMMATTKPIQESHSYGFTVTADTIELLGMDAAVDIAGTFAGKQLSKASDHPGPYNVTVEDMAADGSVSGTVSLPAQ